MALPSFMCARFPWCGRKLACRAASPLQRRATATIVLPRPFARCLPRRHALRRGARDAKSVAERGGYCTDEGRAHSIADLHAPHQLTAKGGLSSQSREASSQTGQGGGLDILCRPHARMAKSRNHGHTCEHGVSAREGEHLLVELCAT